MRRHIASADRKAAPAEPSPSMDASPHSVLAARDREPYAAHDNGQEWLVSWHPPAGAPPGKMHGATAICVATAGSVVLVRADGGTWSLPGGRPEPGESWRETLHREVREEACAVVTGATLLGYGRGECLRGHEAGLVLVRSLWRAEVVLLPWEPDFEMAGRREFPATEALDFVRDALPGGHRRIITRLFAEAGLATGRDA